MRDRAILAAIPLYAAERLLVAEHAGLIRRRSGDGASLQKPVIIGEVGFSLADAGNATQRQLFYDNVARAINSSDLDGVLLRNLGALVDETFTVAYGDDNSDRVLRAWSSTIHKNPIKVAPKASPGVALSIGRNPRPALAAPTSGRSGAAGGPPSRGGEHRSGFAVGKGHVRQRRCNAGVVCQPARPRRRRGPGGALGAYAHAVSACPRGTDAPASWRARSWMGSLIRMQRDGR